MISLCMRCFTFLSCNIGWPRLEYRAHLKLKPLNPVVRPRVQRIAVAELERADGRIPRQTNSRREAERLEIRLIAAIVNLSGVGEYRHSHRLIPRLGPRDREKELHVANDLLPPADRIPRYVLRT